MQGRLSLSGTGLGLDLGLGLGLSLNLGLICPELPLCLALLCRYILPSLLQSISPDVAPFSPSSSPSSGLSEVSVVQQNSEVLASPPPVGHISVFEPSGLGVHPSGALTEPAI